ncbi:hypothetical protein V499_05049 [Pseudogymnoascus sp. VKM F-103]|nr:hypothetical protein V499_05049 [Pseudogymnoascus sp. VKM F-103]
MESRGRSSSQSLRPYLQCVRSSLTSALCLSNFASQTSERHNVPEIEAQTSPEVLLNPLTISRNENERVLIEPSINSIRVSIKIKQADEIEHILVHKFTRFLTQRAEAFFILRRKPVKGYDISFLITNFHTEEMLKHKLVDFIIQFMEEVDKEISEMKLFLNARARFVAESFLTPFPHSLLAFLHPSPTLRSTPASGSTLAPKVNIGRKSINSDQKPTKFKALLSLFVLQSFGYWSPTELIENQIIPVFNYSVATDFVLIEMNQDSFRNPAEGHGQPWLLSNQMRLPTVASVDSQESFASQVPLPYHLPADYPEHGYPSRPLTGQPWTYQDPKQPSGASKDVHGHRSDQFYGNQYGTPQNQGAPAVQLPSYNGRGRFDPAYAPGYNSGYPHDFGNSGYQHPPGGYSHDMQPYGHNVWQGFSVPQPVSGYQQAFGPDRMMSPLGFHPHGSQHPGQYPVAYGPNNGNQNHNHNHNHNHGKPPARRNGHRPRSSVAAINLPSQYNDDFKQRNGGLGQRRYVSSGAETSRDNHDGGHESIHETAEPFPWSSKEYQTPNGKIIESQPTPKTARELGQETPTPLLRSRRNESVTNVTRSFKTESMNDPPPSFSINGRRQSTTTDSSQVSPHTVPEKTARGDSDAVDPFYAESTDIAIYGKKARFDFGTPARAAVMPLHVSLYQPAPGPSTHLAALCPNGAKPDALFPKAVNVVWKGSDPQISAECDLYNSGFKGFISREELVMLVKHVEAPQRSPFSSECPQRPFECLISSVIKYPWHKVHDITIGDRDALFQTAIALCKNLIERIDSGGQDLALNDRLLKRVQRAVLNCCGFSESQKDDFAFLFRMTSLEAGLPPHADHWSVFKTIGAKRNWNQDVILYYIALLREATTSSALVSLAERSAKGLQTGALSVFGNIEIEYPKDVSNMSLSAVGEIEWHAIEALLRKVLE